MAIRSRTTGSAVASTSHAVPLPVGIQAGDRLLVGFVNDNATTTATASAGWTSLGDLGQGGNTNHHLTIFTRAATGSDALTVSLADPGPNSPNQEAVWVSLCLQGDGGTPEIRMVSGAATATASVTAITGLASGAYDSIIFLGLDNGSAINHPVTAPGSSPNNWSNLTSTSGTGVVVVHSMDRSATATAFSPANVTWTGGTEQWVTAHVVVPQATAETITGAASAPLGTLTAAATGVRTTSGTASVPLGVLTAAAAGVRTTQGTAAAALGGLSATAAGGRLMAGTAAASLGGLTATATGAVIADVVTGTAAAPLGALSAAAIGIRTRPGTATAALGGLSATATGSVAAGPAPYQVLNIGQADGQVHMGVDVAEAGAGSRVLYPPSDIAAGLDIDPEFTTTADGQWVQFSTRADAPTTSGSQYPRSEMREYFPGGDDQLGFDPHDGQTHWMRTRVRWMAYTDTRPDIIGMQMHSGDNDVMQVRTQLVSGVVRLVLRMYDADMGQTSSSGIARLSEDYTRGDVFDLLGLVHRDWLYLFSNDFTVWHHRIPTADLPVTAEGDTFFWKTGGYLQFNETQVAASTVGTTNVQRVQHWHTGWVPPENYIGVPEADVGAAGSVAVDAAFTRTASDSGTGIVERQWAILDGPTGAGTAIGTSAALSWTPTVEGDYVLIYGARNAQGWSSPTLLDVTVTEEGSTITGTGAATLGKLTGVAQGTRTTHGAGTATLGALSAAASGTVIAEVVAGTGHAALGAFAASASGTRHIIAVATAPFGGIIATADGTRAVGGTGMAALGALVALANGDGVSVVVGTALAELGGLVAAAVRQSFPRPRAGTPIHPTGPSTGQPIQSTGPSAGQPTLLDGPHAGEPQRTVRAFAAAPETGS